MIAWRGALLALLFLIRYRHQITFHVSLLWLRSASACANRLALRRSVWLPTAGVSKVSPAINGLRQPRLVSLRY